MEKTAEIIEKAYKLAQSKLENCKSVMVIEFVTIPDEAGLGRLKVNGKYYGLPIEVVRKFEQLYRSE